MSSAGSTRVRGEKSDAVRLCHHWPLPMSERLPASDANNSAQRRQRTVKFASDKSVTPWSTAAGSTSDVDGSRSLTVPATRAYALVEGSHRCLAICRHRSNCDRGAVRYLFCGIQMRQKAYALVDASHTESCRLLFWPVSAETPQSPPAQGHDACLARYQIG